MISSFSIATEDDPDHFPLHLGVLSRQLRLAFVVFLVHVEVAEWLSKFELELFGKALMVFDKREGGQGGGEVIKIILSGNGESLLKPNSGQAVSVGSNSIYMGFKDEEAFDYPTWEWQDHIMAFDDEFGENLKYIYGTYTQRLKTRPLPSAIADAADEPLEKEEEDKEEEKQENQGLKELINTKDSTEARILHRNVNTASPSCCDGVCICLVSGYKWVPLE
ncbi:hypothetical protein E2542_SST30205 [Spatholobus suberectus]|nr:hypothetical protein E2542_SST30205 [Spatholobus suberectus]